MRVLYVEHEHNILEWSIRVDVFVAISCRFPREAYTTTGRYVSRVQMEA